MDLNLGNGHQLGFEQPESDLEGEGVQAHQLGFEQPEDDPEGEGAQVVWAQAVLSLARYGH